MKPYPEYKASGIDWLGEIPSHWETISLKHLSDIIMGQSPDGKEISDIGNFFFMQGNAEFGEKYPRPSLYCDTCAKYSRIGDLLMSVRAPVGKLNISDNVYGIGRGLCSIKSTKIKRGFLWYYLLISNAIFNYFSNGSTFEAITVENLKNIPVAFPTVEEQEAISRYLDEVTEKIDALISEKTAQVEEIRAYHSSLITETVTRGLNPDAPLHDPGIDWLGQIPQHWEVSKIKYYAELKSGSNITSEDISEDGYPVYGGNGQRGYYKDYNNDGEYVLIGRQGALCGNINYVRGKFWATEHAVICYPLKEFKTLWFGELLRIMNLNQYSMASAQPGLSVERIKNLYIPVPPLTEQQEIADFLGEKTAKIDRLINELTKQLDELAEYKQAIITEAVTGKVDVRDYKPKI